MAQQIQITVPPNETLKIGEIVEVVNANDIPQETKNIYKKIYGRWVITEITHIIQGTIGYSMTLTLNRNSLHYDPNESTIPTGPFISNNK